MLQDQVIENIRAYPWYSVQMDESIDRDKKVMRYVNHIAVAISEELFSVI